LQIRSNPATGQVDVITAATREGVQEQAAAGKKCLISCGVVTADASYGGVGVGGVNV
jgi:hypothetical protein